MAKNDEVYQQGKSHLFWNVDQSIATIKLFFTLGINELRIYMGVAVDKVSFSLMDLIIRKKYLQYYKFDQYHCIVDFDKQYF